MKKILFLNRYDEQSPKIFKLTLKIAQLLDATVMLAHVYQGTSIPMASEGIHDFEASEKIAKSVERNNKERALEKLKEFVDKHQSAKYSTINIEYKIASGVPRVKILEIIKNQNIDLIVMGMKSPNRFWEAIHGDLAPKMIDLADCPVLLVPPNSKSLKLDKIAYAADLMNPDLAAVKVLFDWTKKFKSELHLVHKKDELLKLHEAAENMKQLIHKISGSTPPSNIHYHLLKGYTKESILAFIEETATNIIAMSTHHRGFWQQLVDPSLTKRIAQEAGIPVLVFKKKRTYSA